MQAEVSIQFARLRVGLPEISFARMNDFPRLVCLTDVFDIRHCGTCAARVPADSLPGFGIPSAFIAATIRSTEIWLCRYTVLKMAVTGPITYSTIWKLRFSLDLLEYDPG